MLSQFQPSFSFAINDYHRARRQAVIREVLARLRGQSTSLLPYEEVRRKLRAHGSLDLGLQEIPLDAIVGSVNRYEDFTREFLPRGNVSPERWARVMKATTDLAGVPPIDVYKIGEVYFVLDGNHRVSIARQLGAQTIQAYVTEIQTRVPLSPKDSPENLILKEEYAQFLELTKLDATRPEADLAITVPGGYETLIEHIDVHRHYMGLERQREIPYKEAVADWYDYVYLPVVQIIRQKAILRDFPGRTEADLYLWITQHRAQCEASLGIDVRPDTAASDLTLRRSPRRNRVVNRLGEKIRSLILPSSLAPGPRPGQWRQEVLTTPAKDRLFGDILIPVNGSPEGWNALEQAVLVAQRENAHLHGLYVVGSETETGSPAAQAIQEEFSRRCREAGIQGSLVVTHGEVSNRICERARWHDMVVVNLAHPPSTQPLAALSSGFRAIIQRCPVPIMAVPQQVTRLDRPFLAYDGSPKAQEALFVAAYLAAKWQVPLQVATILEPGHVEKEIAREARSYLEQRGVKAEYLVESGLGAGKLLELAEAHRADLLLFGGYGHGPLLDVVLGDTVDQILRESRQPMLICR